MMARSHPCAFAARSNSRLERRLPVARRIAEARARAGISRDALAKRAGLEPMSYYDLEHYDDEAFMSVSLAEFCAVARVVALSPRALINPDPAASVISAVSMHEVMRCPA